MSTELLILIQVVFAAITITVILLLIIRRQRKTVNTLKSLLTEVKDDLSGENLTGYLQLEIDDTTAHCSQETVMLRQDLSAEDMAVSLRFTVLQAELALIQDHIGSVRTPWREKIKNYLQLAEKVNELITTKVEQTTRALKEIHNEELEAKDEKIEALEAEISQQKQLINNMKPMLQCLESCANSSERLDRNALELQLHKALLGLCENFEHSEQIRELVYLVHEAYYENTHRSDKQDHQPPTEASTDNASSETNNKNFAQTQNMGILNNIISQQTETIKTLKDQIDQLENQQDRAVLEATVETLDACNQESNKCLESMREDTPFKPDDLILDERVNEVIEQFIQDSARMLERMHLLTNQNKQLELENEALKAKTSPTDGSADDESLGLRQQISEQQEEMLELQKNFSELEQRYIDLSEKTASSVTSSSN